VISEEISIAGPDGKPCLATQWQPENPKAVIVMGHGVSANRGVMATAAKAFAQNDYIVIAMDFWGHGRSRVKFDWEKNPDQILAWCDWSREHFPNLPLAYMGHSMGGFAGAEAFARLDRPRPSAFVSMGALPRNIVFCPMLVAAGDYEELFTIEEARRRVKGEAELVRSPFSDHSLETWDPVLIERIIHWLNNTLHLEEPGHFPWASWALALLSTVLGSIAAVMVAVNVLRVIRSQQELSAGSPSTRTWSLNPYRIAARLLRCSGSAVPRRSGTFWSALLRGICAGGMIVVLLSFLLNTHIFTCHLDHPARWLRFLGLFLLTLPLFMLSANAHDRIQVRNNWQRLLVALLTRAMPVLALSILLRFAIPGMAFAGMILGIFVFIIVVLSIVQVLSARNSDDYRVGAITACILFAWIISFWFPYF
jgi:pimeloyl-ACP methyl ester carboxylesterase